MTESIPSPVGHTISTYELLGIERNQQQKWVAADMELVIYPLGRYFVHVVTKQQYQAESMLNALSNADTPDDVIAYSPYDRLEPFVLNDGEISRDILDRKFTNRVVEEDLAVSLQYSGSVEEN